MDAGLADTGAGAVDGGVADAGFGPDAGTSRPVITGLDPNPAPGGVPFELRVHGSGFEGTPVILLDGAPVATEVRPPATLATAVAPQPRGSMTVAVRTATGTSDSVSLVIGNSAPEVDDPGDPSLDEEADWSLTLTARDFDGDDVRLSASGLPPGAVFDEPSRTVRFRPDFVQSGTYPVTIAATDGIDSVRVEFSLVVRDTIHPPAPTVVQRSDRDGRARLRVEQVTDSFLDSPGHAGRTFEAWVIVPPGASPSSRVPVRIGLHGFSGGPRTDGRGSEFSIFAHDPMNSYWWGYSDQLPGGTADRGTVPNYTQRRVLHLLSWVLDEYPGADPDRVYVSGGSMGGAGAKTFALMYARHLCYVEATIGQAIARNHRPARIAQLETMWGDPQLRLPVRPGGISVWDLMDTTRAMAESAEVQDQFFFTKHGKDDPIIHFGAVVTPSPLTGRAYYDALQAHRIGHYAVWDEGGHGSDDPVLGGYWSDWDWNRVTHPVTFLARIVAFVAFSNSSADQDPGDGSGNGRQTWDESAGFAGDVSVPGDTGWSGDVAGALNRFLRWDASRIVDTEDRFEVPLKGLDGPGDPPPRPGYPSIGNRLDAPLPVMADVTLRRVQRFARRPSEPLAWTFGAASGTVAAGARGAVTIEALPLTTDWTTLVVERAAP